MKTAIQTADAPAAIGAYSQAVRAGDTVYLSGQIGLDPRSMQLAEGIDAQIERVFANLAQNAFDALSQQPDGRLTLQVSVTDSHVVTELADNGPGIPASVLPHVFEPFVTHGKAHGTGLGLAICERILLEHGGRISAHSQAGVGVTITFQLPLARPGETDKLQRMAEGGLFPSGPDESAFAPGRGA